MKIHTLDLVNFKGFADSKFRLNPSLSLFYGPNGIGKSSILEAISLLSNPRIFDGRPTNDVERYLRSLVLDGNYEPLSDGILTKTKAEMRVEGVFTDGEFNHVASLDNEGFQVKLPNRHGSHSFYVDADNPSNLAKFQLMDTYADRFLKLVEAIYGYSCDLDGDVKDSMTGEDGITVTHTFYNDLIITKGTHKIHFAQMSDGEKKIATMIRQLCNPNNIDGRGIILIDNIEMHAYYKRHVKMLDVLQEVFADKQIIATTHSPEMIKHAPAECRFDLEVYKPEYKMMDESEPTSNCVGDILDGDVDDVQYSYKLLSLISNAIHINLDEDAKNEPNYDPNPTQCHYGKTPRNIYDKDQRSRGQVLMSSVQETLLPVSDFPGLADKLKYIANPPVCQSSRTPWRPSLFKPAKEAIKYANKLRDT